jgi:hypothetical protein
MSDLQGRTTPISSDWFRPVRVNPFIHSYLALKADRFTENVQKKHKLAKN